MLVHNTNTSNPCVDNIKTLPRKTLERLEKSVPNIINNAKIGKIKYSANYHGRIPNALEKEMLSNLDSVYIVQNAAQRLVFRKGNDVVIVESKGSSIGNVLTSYGPNGPMGDSGATIFGGSASDPGMPVTHDSIFDGTIPTPNGETLPPATQLYP